MAYGLDRHPGWTNNFITRTPPQIQAGVDAFDHEFTDPKYYAPGIFGKAGPQPGFGKPMPAKNPAFNKMLFEFLGIVGNAKQREEAQKAEMVSGGSLINMRKGPNFMPEFNRRLYSGYT